MMRMLSNSVQFVINKYEVAIFPDDFYSSNLVDITSQVEKSVPELDGIKTVLPIPSNAPRELPRILLRSKNGILNCDISFDKIDIYWLNKSENPKFVIPILKRIQIATNIVTNVLKQETIKRVGLITEFFKITDSAPQDMTSKVLHKNIIKELKNFNINLTYKITLNTHQNCNQVVNIGNGLKTTGNKEQVMLISHDINTHQLDFLKWDMRQVKAFLTEADGKSNINEIYNRFI